MDWPTVILKIKQPALLINATGPFRPPGSPPFLTRAGALATARAMSNCRYLAVPGNHITMAFGENARRVAETIASFVAGEDVGERPRAPEDKSDTIEEAIQRKEAEALLHTT